ncbi:MAG: hypothetical protein LBD75_03240 [Candidatus Peribacteria bacterium]|nr:hypothetical protein [Candidatus Peribacteria bacterium]
MALKQKAIGLQTKTSKDAIFQRRIYTDSINKDDEIYRTRLFFSIQQTKQAVRFMNKSNIIFHSRDAFSTREAGNETKLYRYDYDYNLRNIMEFYKTIDIDNFGVSVEVAPSRDNKKKAPKYYRVHPRSIYCDPMGYGTINNFDFFGVDRTIHKNELLKMKLLNLNEVSLKINFYEEGIRQDEKINRGIVYSYDTESQQCTIYNHFLKWD